MRGPAGSWRRSSPSSSRAQARASRPASSTASPSGTSAAAGAIPSFKGYPGADPRRPFPASICISIDDEIVHGIPGERTIRDGQIVSVDVGAIVDGWHGDGARTFIVGASAPAARARLIDTTRLAMMAGIAAAMPGNHIDDIGAAVEDVGRDRRLRRHPPVRRPRHRPRDARGPAGPELPDGLGAAASSSPGLCLAIEPMFTLGTDETRDAARRLDRRDRRTARWRPTSSTPSRSRTRGPEILTTV